MQHFAEQIIVVSATKNFKKHLNGFPQYFTAEEIMHVSVSENIQEIINDIFQQRLVEQILDKFRFSDDRGNNGNWSVH